MNDDDLDLELEEEPKRPVQRKPRPAPTAPQPAPASKVPAVAPPLTTAAAKQSFLSQLRQLPRNALSLRGFFVGLILLILLVLIAENWVPSRFYFLGARFELPRALAFVIDAAIGAFVMWWWLRRHENGAETDK